MNDTESKQLLLEILNRAQDEEPLKFYYIRSWHEFRYYTRLGRATKLIIKALRKSANNLFKEYCKDIIVGISDINKLLAYSQLQDTICFYTKELDTIKTMLDDYDKYLGEGNFWYSFLGGQRDIWNTH